MHRHLSFLIIFLFVSVHSPNPAFNGLNGIKIDKFSLPGDDPTGKGIIIEIDTTVNNPSAIQMYMGSLTLAISYKDTLMGYVTSTNLTMMRGPQTMSMNGVLDPTEHDPGSC